jgi:predicted deacylase
MSIATLKVVRSDEGAINAPSLKPGDHVIGAFAGDQRGPTLIAIGSLHGNEPAGALALESVAEKLGALTDKLRGRVYLLAGNTRAMSGGVRFIDADLNRQWTRRNLSIVGSEKMYRTAEGAELTELDQILDHLLITAADEVYVLDLHSTSADGQPFATVGDTLRNRRFAQKHPVTILLGIEEQLEGTMLEYLNSAGAVTLGFEGGQHLSEETVRCHEALVWLSLVNAGILERNDVPEFDRHFKQLSRDGRRSRVFEVRYRHAITADDFFEMNPGFNNFDVVHAGQVVASDIYGSVPVTEDGVMLMPLYQKLGEDGFFVGREISPFWLRVSELMRNMGLQNVMHWLPGVHRDPIEPETLVVNTRVARLFPLQIFHLLGYRRRRWINDNLVVSRRRHDTVSPFVTREPGDHGR